MEENNSLLNSLKTGFINQYVESSREYRPQLLTNNPKEGIKVLSTLMRELESCDEFWFSTAFITSGGVATLINTLVDLSARGVKGKILTSQYLNFTEPEALRRLLNFENIELRIATQGSLHSKGYLFKKEGVFSLIIGSSNLTQNALSTNKEWNLKISAANESELIRSATEEFQKEFGAAKVVTNDYLVDYETLWKAKEKLSSKFLEQSMEQLAVDVKPNLMQCEALDNLETLRAQGKNKALIISATGTGKTYLSAFDVKRQNPKRFLFVVHRYNIAKKAKNTFASLLGHKHRMGMYSGKKLQSDKDYLFATIQTISKKEHYEKFDPSHFDYIVIDETHRAGAESYLRIMNYFKPKFLLGMTATPERTDGADIFQMFDYNIAYEIRLHRALEEEMLSPFHYYGITDLTINGEEIDDNTEFNKLTSKERLDRIIEKAEFYGCDDGEVRGLIFCSRKDICISLSSEFNLRKYKNRNYRTVALTGDSSEEDRSYAIECLESDNPDKKIDYIFSVDIFNEGIDIPRVNQIIMLRPTQSAIIFVQQLGRGLRKINNKSYLTVLDFIGNYSNNYLVPIALYGDNSYNKDTLRKFMSSGSSLIPGVSTVNFDKISKERIYNSIDSARMTLKRDLKKDYKMLKYKLGRIPSMMDFIEHGSRDPMLYVACSKSYFNFVAEQELEYSDTLDQDKIRLLELFSSEINNAKRIEESFLIRELIKKPLLEIQEVRNSIEKVYGYLPNEHTIISAIDNLNFKFITERYNGKLEPVNKVYGYETVRFNGNTVMLSPWFKEQLRNKIFEDFLNDSLDCALDSWNRKFKLNSFQDGFLLYEKYSRKDVFRNLNWEKNPVALNVGGYMISPDNSNCPIFVNYHKAEDISNSTKYEDHFLNPMEFMWMSKSKRNLNSNDVVTIRSHEKNKIRLPLFIKKSNDEGDEFYYMGNVIPVKESFEETLMDNDEGKKVSVVRVKFDMETPVEQNIYDYITDSI